MDEKVVLKTATQDQWKSDGICEICRRKAYCRNKCTKRKKRMFQAIQSKLLDPRIIEKIKEDEADEL